MWLLFFLCGTYCAWFQIVKGSYTCYLFGKQGHHSIYTFIDNSCLMCMNRSSSDTLTKPGHWCSYIVKMSNSYDNRTMDTPKNLYLGYYYLWCENYKFMPNATQTPQKKLNVATKQSKKSTDLLVTLATSLFD